MFLKTDNRVIRICKYSNINIVLYVKDKLFSPTVFKSFKESKNHFFAPTILLKLSSLRSGQTH
jgi:hypothetical protein